MSIETFEASPKCKHCGATIYYENWIFIDIETEDVRCFECGKVTTIPVQEEDDKIINDMMKSVPKIIAEENFKNKMKWTSKQFQIIDKQKLIAAAKACKTCGKDCDRCKVIEGCVK